MKKITLLLLFVATISFGQNKYIFRPELANISISDILKHTDSLFNPTSNFSYNCTTNYLLPYDKIIKDSGSKPGYLEEQLALIKKDSLSPYPYGNLGLYYENRGEAGLSQQYYRKALGKVNYLKADKDAARQYSYTSYLKYHVGEDGSADMEKAISINKNDSLAVAFYPMYLITAQKYDAAKKVLTATLEDKNNKYYGYLMLYMANAFETLSKTGSSGTDMAQTFAQLDLKTFVDMRPYQKYFKKNDAYFELMREMTDMFPVSIKMMGTLQDKDYKPLAPDLAVVTQKETFFKKRLQQKEANLFGLYMALGTTSLAKRDFTGAVNYYQKAIDDFPKDKASILFNSLDAYNNIITIHVYNKDYDKAILLLKKIPEQQVVTKADKAKALLNIGKIHFLKNELETATDYANLSIAEQETFDGDLFLGYMYGLQGLNTLGQRYGDKAQALVATPQDLATIVNYYIVVQLTNGNFDGAVQMYEGNKEALAGNCESCDYIIRHYLVAAK
jgi:tetratricopeptide (TPR) repeat protein